MVFYGELAFWVPIYWNEKKIHLLATNRIAFKPTYPVLSRVVDICLYKSLLR